MTITGEKLGKRFGRNWIFRNLSIEISDTDSLVITGPNGSGKSTLLKILSGYLSPNEGVVHHAGKALDIDAFSTTSFTAPYVEVPEEMTFEELLNFHATFRKKNQPNELISEKCQLPLDKVIADFSTGMKQRAQLSTAFYFENDVLFMDEPTSNLDLEGFSWWKEELGKVKTPLIIASNSKREIEICKTSYSLK